MQSPPPEDSNSFDDEIEPHLQFNAKQSEETEELLQVMEYRHQKKFEQMKGDINVEQECEAALQTCKTIASNILQEKLGLHERINKWNMMKKVILMYYQEAYQEGMERIKKIEASTHKLNAAKEQIKAERKTKLNEKEWISHILHGYSSAGVEGGDGLVQDLQYKFSRMDEIKEMLKEKIKQTIMQ